MRPRTTVRFANAIVRLSVAGLAGKITHLGNLGMCFGIKRRTIAHGRVPHSVRPCVGYTRALAEPGLDTATFENTLTYSVKAAYTFKFDKAFGFDVD